MRNKHSYVRSVMILLVAAMVMTACGQQTTSPANQAGTETAKLSVYTSFYPLYYISSQIAGEHAEVKNIVPAGVEPHDFEPTAKDVVALSETDVFVYNGSGFESWVDKALEAVDKSTIMIVNATEGLELLPAGGADHEGEAHSEQASGEASHEEEHAHGEFDPHVWLDPSLLAKQAELVKNALVKRDQAHAADYEQNFAALRADLETLDKEFREMTSQATKKEFMVAHSAFAYIAHKYSLEQISISGLSPSDEPSPAEMKELTEHVKEHGIKYIMFETLTSPKVAEVIARETGVETATLNPLEGLTEEEAKAGKDYLSIMRENLQTLHKALQ